MFLLQTVFSDFVNCDTFLAAPSITNGNVKKCAAPLLDDSIPINQGILKGEVSLYHWPPVWLVWNQLYANWNLCFYLQKRLIQTSQTGSQQYSDTSPFSSPCINNVLSFQIGTVGDGDSIHCIVTCVNTKQYFKFWQHFDNWANPHKTSLVKYIHSFSKIDYFWGT